MTLEPGPRKPLSFREVNRLIASAWVTRGQLLMGAAVIVFGAIWIVVGIEVGAVFPLALGGTMAVFGALNMLLARTHRQ